MLMRYKPLRGEKHKLKDGRLITIIEPVNGFTKMLKVILPNEKMVTIDLNDIQLSIIDTANYEKI